MRPPDLPGGNWKAAQTKCASCHCFNEAAGFTRRKPRLDRDVGGQRHHASMRPPDLPGGNPCRVTVHWSRFSASMRPPDLPGGNGRVRQGHPWARALSFNEAAGFTRRKRVDTAQLADDSVTASMRPPDLPGGNTGGGGLELIDGPELQ